MKKGQIVEGIVKKVEFPNKAIVHVKEITEQGEENRHEVMVKGALPGQTVRLAIKKMRKGKGQGILKEVIEPSPLETEKPVCPHFGKCGGCSYQTIPYEKQLELKKEQVLSLILPVYEKNELAHSQKAENDVSWEKRPLQFDGIIPSPHAWAYRNKMEFSFGDEVKDGPLTLGLHKKGSFHDVLHVSGCQIIHRDYSLVLDCVRDYCAEQGLNHYKKRSHEGLLRHLLVRRSESTGEMLVALVTSSQYRGDEMEQHLAALSQKLQELPLEGTLTGFLHILNDSLGDVVQSDSTRIIYGKDWFMEEILGLKYRITPFSFFQTNTRGAEMLYRCVRDYMLYDRLYSIQEDQRYFAENIPLAKEGVREETNSETELAGKKESVDNIQPAEEALSDKEKMPEKEKNGVLGYTEEQENEWKKDATEEFRSKKVFDLYSGTGTIAQTLAPVMEKAIGVEIVEEAVEAAKENARLNGLDNCEFLTGDVLKILDEIQEKPDYIILDPPRDGLHPKALRKIAEYQVEKIVYISCKPTSLARDLEVLQEYGYRVERMCCVDLFPWTVHVECVIKLQRRDM